MLISFSNLPSKRLRQQEFILFHTQKEKSKYFFSNWLFNKMVSHNMATELLILRLLSSKST